jgi:CelD/BcsL family acetyltransferase involved in cellulose biosynthesis
LINWEYRRTTFKFQLSLWTLFSVQLDLQVRAEKLIDQMPPVAMPIAPEKDELMEGSQGFLIRCLPILAELPAISKSGDYLCYISAQYYHYYIDLGLSFEAYQKKFSSKTRSTITRKLRKYSEYCGGTISWKTYKLPSEMKEFFGYARAVSKLTYQEQLLNAGIPSTEGFLSQMESLAAEQQVRAYILFDGERPVSYLYCPTHDGVVFYAFLGYDPEYKHLSVGTVLHWLALEQLFAEGCFKYFDFTEGQSDHKRLFSTHQQRCADVFLVKPTLRNTIIIFSHMIVGKLSNFIGNLLDRLGLKAKIRKTLRFSK